MKNRNIFYNVVLILLFTISLTSCDVIGDIFEVGLWTGIIGLVLIIVLVFWIFNKIRR